MKDFYRISKERLETYINCLDDASHILWGIRPNRKKSKADRQKFEDAWEMVVEVLNGLYGFKNYEDVEAGGEIIQDLWINFSDLDNDKFHGIEFKEEIEKARKKSEKAYKKQETTKKLQGW